LRGDPLSLADRRARHAARRARADGVDRGGRADGHAPPRARRRRRAVPPRVVPDAARPRAARELHPPAPPRARRWCPSGGSRMSVAVREALARVLDGHALEDAAMDAAMDAILGGDATPGQIGGLAIALRMRGETAAELAAAARVMRARALPAGIDPGGVLFD